MNDGEQLLKRITGCQGRLLSFIVAALGEADVANEVLQEVHLVMWRKPEEFAFVGRKQPLNAARSVVVLGLPNSETNALPG